jgi:hypothetical protein
MNKYTLYWYDLNGNKQTSQAVGETMVKCRDAFERENRMVCDFVYDMDSDEKGTPISEVMPHLKDCGLW